MNSLEARLQRCEIRDESSSAFKVEHLLVKALPE
jgi:hypothetical protein